MYPNLDLSLELERILEGQDDKYTKTEMFFKNYKDVATRHNLTNSELFRATTDNKERMHLGLFMSKFERATSKDNDFKKLVDEVWNDLEHLIKNVAVKTNDFLAKLDTSDNSDDIIQKVKPKFNRNR